MNDENKVLSCSVLVGYFTSLNFRLLKSKCGSEALLNFFHGGLV